MSELTSTATTRNLYRLADKLKEEDQDVCLRGVHDLEYTLRSLEAIKNLDPSKDSDEGFNEWGEADCFRKAQEIACTALQGGQAASNQSLRQPKREGWVSVPKDATDAMVNAADERCEYRLMRTDIFRIWDSMLAALQSEEK